MSYEPTPEVELLKVKFEEDQARAIEFGLAVWDTVRPSVRRESERLDAIVSEDRDQAMLLGPDAYEFITGERPKLFIGAGFADDTEGLIGFHTVALDVKHGEVALLIHGADVHPLDSDVTSALCYLSSIGYRHTGKLRHCGTTEEGEFALLEVS